MRKGDMNKLIITQGIAGAGKSYWAKQYCQDNPTFVRVNRDDLRHMRGKYWIPEQETLISEWEEDIVKSALAKDLSVVVDATHLDEKYIGRWKRIAKKYAVDFEIKVFDTPVEECITNDAMRTPDKSVGEEVIRKQSEKFEAYKKRNQATATRTFVPVQVDLTLPPAVIVDLDGTVAIHNGRNPYDYDKCDTDLVNEPVLKILDNYPYPNEIIFVSGREDSCKQKTINWLKEIEKKANAEGYVILGDRWQLHMRKTGDRRSDDIVKYEIFNEHIRDKYNVEFVLDDRDSVVKMWRKIGLTCLQVAEGNF